MRKAFSEVMKDSVASALEIHGITADSIVAEDGMVIIIGPKEKRTDAKSTHGGFAGKSLIEKIRDDSREVIKSLEDSSQEEKEYTEGLLDGILHSLSILRGTTPEEEKKISEYEYKNL